MARLMMHEESSIQKQVQDNPTSRTVDKLRQIIWVYVPGGLVVKNLPANAGDLGLIHGLGRSLGEGNGNPLQYSCLENPVDRGAWQATVHGVAKSWTRLSD